MTVVSMDHSQVFSTSYWRAVEFPAFLAAVMMITVLWYNRLPKSLSAARNTGPCNWAIVLSLSDSLLFVIIGMWLVFGIGTSYSEAVCSFGYWLCIFAYALAKLAVSFFLIERARLVKTPLVNRRSDKLYIFNCCLSSLWLIVLVVMIWAKASLIRPDGECSLNMNGGGPVAGLIATDAFMELYYTTLFALPLYRGKWQNPTLRRLAVRSALVALLGLASSATNLIIYASHNGHELSWVCLFSCTADTAFCAAVLCLLTGRDDESRDSSAERTGGTMSGAWHPGMHTHSIAQGDPQLGSFSGLTRKDDLDGARAVVHSRQARRGTAGSPLFVNLEVEVEVKEEYEGPEDDIRSK